MNNNFLRRMCEIVRQDLYREPVGIKSSYAQRQIGRHLWSVAWNLHPDRIVDFGLLEGYSLSVFAQYKEARKNLNPDDKISLCGWDLFEDYPHNHSTKDVVRSNVEKHAPGVHFGVHKGSVDEWLLNGIDVPDPKLVTQLSNFSTTSSPLVTTPSPVTLFHLDISNDGDKVNRFMAAAVYREQVYGDLSRSWLLLEGGSEERDRVEWMITHNRPSIEAAVSSWTTMANSVLVTREFPSLTLVDLGRLLASKVTMYRRAPMRDETSPVTVHNLVVPCLEPPK